MTFDEFARYLDQLEGTRSRNELVRIVSELYQACSPDEIQPVTYLIQGRLAPFFEPVEIGLGERLIQTAVATAYSLVKDDVVARSRELGDLGAAVQAMAPSSRGAAPAVTEVHARLFEIAGLAGEGSQLGKLERFSALLAELDGVSAKHLVRITTGKIRLGIGDITVLDALSLAKAGDRSLRKLLEGAYNRTSDLGLIAGTLWSEGTEAVEALQVTVGRPLRPQLAERLPDPDAVIRRLGLVGVQPKYDGFRMQIHRHGPEVSLFSRNLENMTAMFPDLVEAALALPVESVILDSEAIAYSPESEEYLPFQETMGRRRKLDIEAFAERAPLRAFVFDVLYHDGGDLTPLTYQERFDRLGEIVRGSERLSVAPLTSTDSAEVLRRELLDNISRGLEGVVAKRLDSPYQAGARNFNWVKLKRNTSGELNDTIDVVLLGYYRGKGRRAEFGAGALLAGVYDADRDEFRTLTKIGTGLSDAGWRELYERVRSLEVPDRPARVVSLLTPDVWLEPQIVAEVLADEITPSPRHTAGMTDDRPGLALRFPRIVSFRSADKKPDDATTVRELLEMFEQQRSSPAPDN
ncbi:MAG TPA: ATP-dependent DNA ligase [Candidatus Dormibacteraeota bacterium]